MIGVVEQRDAKNGSGTVIKLGITWGGKDALEKIAETYGMKEQVVAGRIYEWFIKQDDIVQRAVLGLLHGLEKDAATEFMKRLARDGGKDISFDGDEAEALKSPELRDYPVKKPRRRRARDGHH